MNVAIRKFEERDIVNKIKWINDERNNRYLHYNLLLEYENTCLWFNKIQKSEDRYDAVIEVDDVAVGLTGLLSIDRKNSKAEYYIMIGCHEYKGRGIASKATELILKYGFYKLGLNKIYLYTEIGNIAAQKLFEKIGFKKEGLLKNDLICNGRKIDRFVYALLAEEYVRNK